jgi:hypothetical protein
MTPQTSDDSIAGDEALDDFFRDAAGSSAPAAVEPAPPDGQVVPAAAPKPTRRDRKVATKLRARKVRRIVRHVEPWSVLKISLIFFFCLWVIFLIAGVLLWSAAVGSGTIDNVENFIADLFALEEFTFDAEQIFRSAAIAGLIMVVALTGFNVLLAVLFNLISDLTGGLRVTVIEEETARVVTRRPRSTA